MGTVRRPTVPLSNRTALAQDERRVVSRRTAAPTSGRPASQGQHIQGSGNYGPVAHEEIRRTSVRRTVRDIPPEEEESPSEEPAAPAWFAVARGAAFFVGCVTLLNLLGEMRFSHVKSDAWWVDLHRVPKPLAQGYLGLTATLLVLFSLFPRIPGILRRLATLTTLGLIAAAGWTGYRFFQHLHGGQIPADSTVPFSLHIAGCLLAVLPGLLAGTWERSNFFKDFLIGSLTIAACVTVLPVVQFFCLGKTQEHCDADAVVMLSDESEAGKKPEKLAERVKAACALFHQSHASKLVFFNRGEEASKESENAVKSLALEEGIPEAQIIVNSGVTQVDASVVAAAQALKEQKIAGVLVLAPFYQVPRVKLCCQRAGLDVHSVPMQEELRLKEVQASLVHEAVALWMCFLQPLST